MTEQTIIARKGEKFVLQAWGGYDGYLTEEFDTIEEALVRERELWNY